MRLPPSVGPDGGRGLFRRNIHGSYAGATERGEFACRVSFLGFVVDFRLGIHLLSSHTLRRYVA